VGPTLPPVSNAKPAPTFSEALVDEAIPDNSAETTISQRVPAVTSSASGSHTSEA
jgi:hypothetical protein